jgi:uncharacterized protein YeaO (DUF488 family)
MPIFIKRVYDKPSGKDGYRVLVDRLWPRGLSKVSAHIDLWCKEVAPSNDLRKWFGHNPAKWEQFRNRYFKELDEHPEMLYPLIKKAGQGPVTLLFAAQNRQFNSAAALLEYLEKAMKQPPLHASE